MQNSKRSATGLALDSNSTIKLSKQSALNGSVYIKVKTVTTIEGILFDLDQTLMDRDKSLRLFLDWQWNSQKALQIVCKNDFAARFTELDNNGKVWKDIVYSQVCADFGIDNTQVDFLLKDYLTNFSQHAVLFPDVMKVLKFFKQQQIKLGIITNGREDLQSSVIHACGLDKMIDVILISEVEMVKKPDPVIFNSAFDRLLLDPSTCAFIGDNPDADIKGAYDVGMKTIWKQNDFFPAPDKSITSFIFENFKELPSIIDRLKNVF